MLVHNYTIILWNTNQEKKGINMESEGGEQINCADYQGKWAECDFFTKKCLLN